MITSLGAIRNCSSGDGRVFTLGKVLVLLTVLSSIWISGCSNDGRTTSEEKPAERPPVTSGGKQPGQTPNTGPRNWGELQCQISQNCRNNILNLKFQVLVDFFTTNFSVDRLEDEDEDFRVFVCGREASRLWTDRFGNEDSRNLGNLYVSVLDLKTCVIKPDIELNLKQYFENQEDYKDESQQQ